MNRSARHDRRDYAWDVYVKSLPTCHPPTTWVSKGPCIQKPWDSSAQQSTLHRPIQQDSEPRRHFEKRGEIDPSRNAHRLEAVDKILGRDVAAGARRKWAPTKAPDGRVEVSCAGVDRRNRVRNTGVPGVMEVAAYTSVGVCSSGKADEILDLRGGCHADRVGKGDLQCAGGEQIRRQGHNGLLGD